MQALPPYPLRFAPCICYREKISALSSLVDSCRIHVRRYIGNKVYTKVGKMRTADLDDTRCEHSLRHCDGETIDTFGACIKTDANGDTMLQSFVPRIFKNTFGSRYSRTAMGKNGKKTLGLFYFYLFTRLHAVLICVFKFKIVNTLMKNNLTRR